MTSLRILHVVFSSRLAGSERYCADLANRQAEAGHEVHVVGRRGSPLPMVLAQGVRFHALPLPVFRRFFLRRLADEIGADICHGHLSGACKTLSRLGGRCRSVATLHVGYKPHQHARLDGLICVNHAQARRLADYAGVARTIPNWMPRPAAAVEGRGLRAELGIAPDALVIGAVGRLHASKGMDVLVRAFRAAAPARSALVIFGEGPQRAELERLAAGDPRIHLAGFCGAVQTRLRQVDLFVSPSREETFGLAILEAMSCGLPVIATAAEGPAEFLRNQPVMLVEPGSVAALAEALRTAAERFARGALPRLDYDLSDFDPAARVAAILELYGHIIQGGRRTVPAPSPAPVAA